MLSYVKYSIIRAFSTCDSEGIAHAIFFPYRGCVWSYRCCIYVHKEFKEGLSNFHLPTICTHSCLWKQYYAEDNTYTMILLIIKNCYSSIQLSQWRIYNCAALRHLTTCPSPLWLSCTFKINDDPHRQKSFLHRINFFSLTRFV